MFRFMSIAIVALATLFVASDAMAGGGGSKRDATIKVKNSVSGLTRIGVILNKTPQQVSDIAAAANPEKAFTDAGGKFVDSGKTVSFSVQGGTHQYIYVDPSVPAIIGSGSATVGRGATLNLTAQ